MSETEKELWKILDLGVFGTNDPEEIRRKAQAAAAAWQEERSTLGGYLRSVRKMRELMTEECAAQAGVNQDTWQAWEANQELPSYEELEEIISGLHFGAKKREALYRLRKEAPLLYLRRLATFRPDLKVARGVSMTDLELEWEALPNEVRRLVGKWAETKELGSLKEVFEYLWDLTAEQQGDWLREVGRDA